MLPNYTHRSALCLLQTWRQFCIEIKSMVSYELKTYVSRPASAHNCERVEMRELASVWRTIGKFLTRLGCIRMVVQSIQVTSSVALVRDCNSDRTLSMSGGIMRFWSDKIQFWTDYADLWRAVATTGRGMP